MERSKKMVDSKKIQITLSDTAMEKLERLCEEKGVKRSAIIAMAIDKFYREEKSNESK